MQRPFCSAIALFSLQRGSGTLGAASRSEAAKQRQLLASALCDASADCVRMRDFARDISNMFDYNWCARPLQSLRWAQPLQLLRRLQLLQ